MSKTDGKGTGFDPNCSYSNYSDYSDDSESTDCCLNSSSNNECKCSECAGSSSDCSAGVAVCALGPGPRRRYAKKTRSTRKNARQQSCRGGAHPSVRKPKKTVAKTRKVTKKTPKKTPRGKNRSCCCCSTCF